MAGTRGTQDTALNHTAALVDAIEAQPWSFGFFQAVRLFQFFAAEREPVGRFSRLSEQALRFSANTDMAFPASELQSIEREQDGTARLRVNFMGCTGPMGVLPLVYSALFRERARARDYAARDFLDLFHNRLLALFYGAWEKYRFGVAFERGERDRLSHHLSDLIGIGSAGMENRQQIPDTVLQFYAGLLGMSTHPATALEQILSDHFAVAAEVDQFVGTWHPIDREHECRLGEENGFSQQLGIGALAGDRIWDEQSRIRIRLGPLTLAQYEDFLPDGAAYRRLRALASFYAGMLFDIELELVLRRDEVPGCDLQSEGEAGVRLGWTTWVTSAPFSRDPGDTILYLEQAA